MMTIEEETGSIAMNGAPNASIDMELDQAKVEDELIPKARKPYTITKQRERWTEEEHTKFLEALKLYGRAWRRIEEHVGSKTAIQIRSHAQKFFSKVVKDAEASNPEATKAIEIPPPRPKRKPMHPYPRKLAHSSSVKGITTSKRPERSLSLVLPGTEQENGSPKSVLSTLASELSDSNVPNSPKGCSSPASSDLENGYLSSNEKHDNPKSATLLNYGANQVNERTKVKLSKENLLTDPPMTSLKLFGRTVIVSDIPKSTPLDISSDIPKNLITTDTARGQDRKEIKEKNCQLPATRPEALPSCSMDPKKNIWTTWPAGPSPLFYCLQFPSEQAAPLPWLAMYGGFPYAHSSAKENWKPSVYSMVDGNLKEVSKEGSRTGSNSDSITDAGSKKKVSEIADTINEVSTNKGLALKANSSSAFCKPMSSKSSTNRGFMPYKRCVASKDAQPSKLRGEEKEAQQFQLCL